MTYVDIKALRGHYGDHKLAAAYCYQLEAKIQLSGKSQQEFAAAVKQVAHRTLVGLHVDLIQWEEAE
jgi:hypothetical protein